MLDVGRDFITRNISPINTAVFFTTGILVPLLDLMRPVLPALNYAAGVAVIGFIVLAVVKLLGRPRPVPTALVATLGICSVIFAAGAYASSLNTSGFLASSEPAIARVQASVLGLEKQSAEINKKLDSQVALLTDIRSGKSDNPRVSLNNMGVSWDVWNMLRASQRGDLQVVELFLKGEMPPYLPAGDSIPSVAIESKFERIAEQLELFKKYGYDLKSSQAINKQSNLGKAPNLYALAVESKNTDAETYLRSQGFQPKDYEVWHQSELAKQKAVRDKAPKGYFF